MTERTITVTVPDHLYSRLEEQAHSAAQSVGALISQTLTHSLPPAVETELPLAVQAELAALEHLSNEALWVIAQSTMNDDKLALYDLLIERQNTRALTPEGEHLLTVLSADADALTLRKAQAYALLHARGYALPSARSDRFLRWSFPVRYHPLRLG